MENASKALIIAGAILISIVIIGLGVLVVGQGQGTANAGGNALSQQEINTFNAKFTYFEGSGKNAATVKTLYETVRTNNTAGDNNQVKIKNSSDSIKSGTAKAGDFTSGTTPSISATKTYTIEITGYSAGLVSEITVK